MKLWIIYKNGIGFSKIIAEMLQDRLEDYIDVSVGNAKKIDPAFLVEEKLKEMPLHKNDPILRLRGKLKGKKGGTALFMQDKKAEIEKEYAI